MSSVSPTTFAPIFLPVVPAASHEPIWPDGNGQFTIWVVTMDHAELRYFRDKDRAIAWAQELQMQSIGSILGVWDEEMGVVSLVATIQVIPAIVY